MQEDIYDENLNHFIVSIEFMTMYIYIVQKDQSLRIVQSMYRQ